MWIQSLAQPGRRGRHMAGGASSCSAARHCEAEPLCTDRKVVERQCQTSSCRARSAGCGQAGLCASGSGGEWERCLVGRCGSAEQHGEHRLDGADARKPWQPSLAAAGAHTQTSRGDGRCCASLGQLLSSSTPPQRSSDWSRTCACMVAVSPAATTR